MGRAGTANRRGEVTGALLLVQVFFGLHYLAAKLLLEEIPPRTWAVIRVTAAAALVLGIALAVGRSIRFPARDLARLALCAIFGVVINQVCFVEGLQRTTPAHSAIINTTIPVATLLISVALGRETIDARKFLAFLVSFAGVMLVIRPERASFSSATVAGDLLTLANAFSYSVFLVLSKRLLSRSDPMAATAVVLSFGSVGILGIGWSELRHFHPSQVSARTWALGAFIVLFATVGAYFLNYWALARVDSSVVALFIYLQPLVATSTSALALGERPGRHVLWGAAMICLGVFLSVVRPRTASPGKR